MSAALTAGAGILPRMREPFRKFFADRGTHLAAMIAYFALLSFVPLLFLAFSLLGLAGRADESSYLVTELERALPKTSVSSIVAFVRTIQNNAATLGLVAAIATLVMETTFQTLPVYLHESKQFPAAQAFGGPAIQLVWMYLMANVIVFGAEVNWWAARREPGMPEPAEEAAGLA